MTATNLERFAIYFTFAPEHPLYQKASQWLGHCIYHQVMDTSATLSAASERFRTVERAALYGFHATLKPPFRLLSGTTRAELENRLRDFVSSVQPFTCSPLKVDLIGNFIALVPDQPCHQLNLLADQCVRKFEPFRAPLNAAEIQKRLGVPLTPQQQGMLEQWGYPYVMDEFRFHMTLTDKLPDNIIESAVRQLKLEFSPLLNKQFRIDCISLCHQEKPGDPFYFLQSYTLGE